MSLLSFQWSPQIFLSKYFENNICSPSLMFLKIISAAWEVFCGVSLRSILNPADSSKHWLSAHSLNFSSWVIITDHFVCPESWLILWKRVITWRSYPPQTHNAKNLKKKTRLCDFDRGGMRAALSYVTTEEQSASGRVCSLSPTELSGRRRQVVLNCFSRPPLMLVFFLK